MFERRLLMLAAVAIGLAAVMGLRAAHLTIGPGHSDRKQAAENKLRVPDLIPTIRGRIVDRRGRVLATDEPGWDVMVDYSVIVGAWAYDQGRRAARKAIGERWNELSRSRRDRLAQEHAKVYERQVAEMWHTLAAVGKVSMDDIERRRNSIRRRVQVMAAYLWEHWRERRMQELGEPVAIADVARPIAEQRQAHSVLRDISDRQRIVIQGFIAEAEHEQIMYEQARRRDDGPVEDHRALGIWRQVHLKRPRQRRYPHETLDVSIDRTTMPTPLRSDEPKKIEVEGVGLHVIGLMRDAWADDINARPFDRQDDLGGYLDGDRMGSVGIEATAEQMLRGVRGWTIRHLDTGKIERQEPIAGRDVTITLDIQLQAYVQALMEPETGLMQVQPWHRKPDTPGPEVGTPLNGSAVVLDIETGHVLAAVSMPSMPWRLLRDEPSVVYDNKVDMPYLNRVVARPYQPGSTIKPLILCAATSAGVYALDDHIICRGYLDPGHPNRYRCWIFKVYRSQHGPLPPNEAIARSCNVFFYTLGRRMGSRRLVPWLSSFGLGSPTHCGLPGESGGDLPDMARANERNAPGFTQADAIFMGIGQGPVRWTPLQAADAYATIARDGQRISPTFLMDTSVDPTGNSDRIRKDLHINPAAIDQAILGLYGVVNESFGTGRVIGQLNREPIFNVENVTIYGKSGTAQAVPHRVGIDDDGDGFPDRYGPIVKQGDHAWFIAMIKPKGARKPTHLIVVVVEYAGSGGQVAGPIVNQIIHGLQRLTIIGGGS